MLMAKIYKYTAYVTFLTILERSEVISVLYQIMFHYIQNTSRSFEVI